MDRFTTMDKGNITMITSCNVGHHVHQLRETRQIAMTCARVSRALEDAEMLVDYVRQARIANRLILNARALLRTEARVS